MVWTFGLRHAMRLCVFFRNLSEITTLVQLVFACNTRPHETDGMILRDPLGKEKPFVVGVKSSCKGKGLIPSL